MSECRYNCKHYDWSVGTCNGECDIEKHYSLGYQQGRVEVIESIRQIIDEYNNGTDAWNGMDEAYVIDRIEKYIEGNKE